MQKLLARLRPAAGSRYDVIGLGECSLDEVWRLQEGAPPPGGKGLARGRDLLGGGQVATAMVACRRLGLSVALLGAVESPRWLLRKGRRDEARALLVQNFPQVRTVYDATLQMLYIN